MAETIETAPAGDAEFLADDMFEAWVGKKRFRKAFADDLERYAQARLTASSPPARAATGAVEACRDAGYNMEKWSVEAVIRSLAAIAKAETENARSAERVALTASAPPATMGEITLSRADAEMARTTLDSFMGDTDPLGDTPALLACQALDRALSAAPAPAVTEAVAWRAVAHPETRMGTMVDQIEWMLVERADSLYGKGHWDLQPLFAHPAPEEAARLRARVAELEDALRPFAETEPVNIWHDEDGDAGNYVLTENQFRRARSTLAGGE